eukprot:2057042-Rhodomonas_salina.3
MHVLRRRKAISYQVSRVLELPLPSTSRTIQRSGNRVSSRTTHRAGTGSRSFRALRPTENRWLESAGEKEGEDGRKRQGDKEVDEIGQKRRRGRKGGDRALRRGRVVHRWRRWWRVQE